MSLATMHQILDRLEHVEADIARLADRRFVVRPDRIDEFVDVLRFHVDVDERDEHRMLVSPGGWAGVRPTSTRPAP